MFDFEISIAVIVAILFGYLFGSIPWALVIGKVFYNTDVRKHGSGNLGGSNAGRVLGAKVGLAVTIMDGLKGLITVVLCEIFIPEASVLAGVAACAGHCFPIFANFKGGKAVATAFGYIIATSFVTNQFIVMAAIPLGLFFLLLYLTKIVSLSSMILIGTCTAVSAYLNGFDQVTFSFLILWLFIVYRHKSNINNLLKGEEKKITWM